ncbi:MAG: hypothetical protein ABSF75_06755, partial [Terracidiphilus sp.]
MAFLLPFFLVATLLVSANSQQSEPAAPGTASANEAAPQPTRMVAREMWIHVPESFPNGLDALEVYMDLPGRHPLVVLTHGTSNEPDVR